MEDRILLGYLLGVLHSSSMLKWASSYLFIYQLKTPRAIPFRWVCKVCSVAVQWQVAIGLYDEMCTAKQDHVRPNALTLLDVSHGSCCS